MISLRVCAFFFGTQSSLGFSELIFLVIRSSIDYLRPKRINFDAVDSSEYRSRRVISFY